MGVTRKRYWIESVSLEDKIYTSPYLPDDFDLNDLFRPGELEIRQLRLKPNQIEIQLQTKFWEYTHFCNIDDMSEAFLVADVVLELDDRKEIQNLKVISVKTQLQPLGATSGRRQYFLNF